LPEYKRLGYWIDTQTCIPVLISMFHFRCIYW